MSHEMRHEMRVPATLIRSAAVLLGIFAATAAFGEGPDPRAALKNADEVMYPPSFSMSATMSTEKPEQDPAIMGMEVSNKEGLGSFIELVSPPRSKGIRFLQTKSALYMCSPKAGSRTSIRLSPARPSKGAPFPITM